jgi:uncharacterized protein YndB with AHSA1/START domain
MTQLVDDTTVRTSIEVDVTADRAFHLFTAEIAGWWDTDHHILRAPLASMEFQPFVGGHIIDHGTDGSECRWARVLAYEPPHRVVFSWDINLQWEVETDPSRCSEVEITFTPVSQRSTRVQLSHCHLDRHGPGWEGMRDAVASGWSLDGFAAFAESQSEGDSAMIDPLPQISDETMGERLRQAKPYTIALLHATEKCVHPDVDPIIWEHGRRNMALVETGDLLIVLPVSDESGLAGVGIFAGDVGRVTAILDGDPGVQAGIFRYELHPARGFPGATLT